VGNVEGCVDRISTTRITGWVWDRDTPNSRLNVRIEVGGAVVANVTADRYRPDLLAKGKGDGNFGFLAVFDEPLAVSRMNVQCLAGAENSSLLVGKNAFEGEDLSQTETTIDRSRPAHPVFIVGSPRSGTTILAKALRESGYFGFDEGHLLSLIKRTREIVDIHFAVNDLKAAGLLLSHIDREKLKLDLFSVLKQYQESANPQIPWIDKTPGADMYFAAPFILKLWPSAKFIFAKRRAIENIVSRMKKFPGIQFASHCEDWVVTMKGWRDLRESGLPNIEIDQYDIAHQPDDVGKRLAAFLQLPSSAVDSIATEMRRSRPEASGANTAEKIYTLDSTGWSRDQIAVFKSICASEMDVFNYTYDETYRRGGRA
jgi:hypothetical protein